MMKLVLFALVGTAASCADRVPARETGDGADSIRGTAGADVSGLALEASVAILDSAPLQIRGILRVENPTAETIRFDVGGCPVFLRVYEITGDRVWDQGDGAICTMILRTVTIGPGAGEGMPTAEVRAAEILGDELPDGMYRVGVYLALVGGGQPEASAGEVELAR